MRSLDEHFLEPKERSLGLPQALIALFIILLFGLWPILPGNLFIAIDLVFLLLTGIAWITRWRLVAALSAFCTVCLALAYVGLPSALSFLGGFVAYGLIYKLGHGQDRKIEWLTVGKVTRETAWLALASVLISAAALVIWFVTDQPNINDLITRFLPEWPWALLIISGVVFATINAAAEELAYRGVIMNALEQSLGIGTASLLVQAAAFGIIHVHGFPRGGIGMALAFIFGILMGLLRRKSGGFLVPWTAHVGADIVIALIVITFARVS